MFFSRLVGTMPKKQKAAGGQPPPEPGLTSTQPSEEVDFEPPTSPSTPDGEGKSTSPQVNSNNKRDASPSLRADQESSPRSSSSSSSSTEEATQPDDSFESLTPVHSLSFFGRRKQRQTSGSFARTGRRHRCRQPQLRWRLPSAGRRRRRSMRPPW